MSEVSVKFNPETWRAMTRLTSLRASGAGPSHSDGQDGETDRCGQDPAPASHSQTQERKKLNVTQGTCGPTSSSSSRNADLQQCLESRLQVRLGETGSPLYAVKWKHWPMKSGQPICALRASARRISGKDYSGWPTPNAGPQNDTDTKFLERRAAIKKEKKNGNGFGLTLGMAAQLAGWRTPQTLTEGAHTAEDTLKRISEGKPLELRDQVMLSGWGTPTSRDHKDGDCDLTKVPVNALLGRECLLSSAQTEKRGRLNPKFCLWLMGFPEEWDEFAVMETQ